VGKGFATKRFLGFDSQTQKRERGKDPMGPSGAPIRPDSLSLSFNDTLWVNDLVAFGPRNEPVAKSGQMFTDLTRRGYCGMHIRVNIPGDSGTILDTPYPVYPFSVSRAMSDVTRILSQIEDGDGQAAEKLLPLVYEELRKLAAARMAQENPGQTLQATALVHEAYLRLVDVDKAQHWDTRGHFFSAAAEAMRRILVESARRKARVRHGRDYERAELEDVPQPTGPEPEAILAVDEALTQLAEDDPSAADVVKLHFFAGMTLDETAEALAISRATVYRQWAYARSLLHLALQEAHPDS
jgi:RNA polymerase sigma factor (TIGR02999 family)